MVHRIRNVNFNMNEHFSEERKKRSTADASKNLADKWGFGLQDGDTVPETLARYHFKVTGQLSGSSQTAFQNRETIFFLIPKHVMLLSAVAILDAISMVNRYGIHIWKFLMECENRAQFIKSAENIFAKAKIGDPEDPFRIKEMLERNNPGVKVKLDDDDQPILESLAGAIYTAYKQLYDEAELLIRDTKE